MSSASPVFPGRPHLNGSKKKYSMTSVVSNHYDIQVKYIENEDQEIKFITWAVELEKDNETGLEETNVMTRIERDAREFFYQVLKKFRMDIREKIGNFISSGQILYSLAQKDWESVSQLKFVNEDGPNLILSRKTKPFSISDTGLSIKDNGEIYKVLNIIQKSTMKRMGYNEIGRHKKYYNNHPIQKTCGNTNFLILTGFKCSISKYEKKLLVNLDFNTRLLRESNLWSEVKEALNSHYSKKDMNRFLTERVVGKSFQLIHANNRIVRIEFVDDKMKISDPFPNKEFKSYADYFLKRYHKKLSDNKQWMCCESVKNYQFKEKLVDPQDIHKDHKGRYVLQMNWYPAELLRPCGLTDDMVSDFRIMREISTITKLTPQERTKKGDNFIHQNNNLQVKKGSKEKHMDFAEDLRLEIIPNSNTQQALLFTPPTIYFAKKQKLRIKLDRSNFNMKKEIYDEKRSISNWVLVYDRSKEDFVEQCVNGLIKSTKVYGIKLKKPALVLKLEQGMVRADDLYDTIMEEVPKTKIVFVFINKRNYSYDPIKLYFNKKKMPTQFYVNFNPKSKALFSTYSKLVLQMMAKLGRVLWKVDRALYSDKSNGSVLIGIDIIRKRQGHMISAVSTVSKSFDKVFNQFAFIPIDKKKASREHLAFLLSKLIKKCVKNYIKKNDKKIPDNVIIYRSGNGNSAGLLGDMAIEATMTREELKSLTKDNVGCRLAYFGVSKKMEDRFFESNGNNKVYNPRGGLIIANRVTQPERFDFFMVAQNVNQGCATPTHYFCVYNDSELTADEIYSLTYYQTFNYFNWQGPVRVPGVVKYAEKQLEQMSTILKYEKNWSDTMNLMPNKMYYL